MHSFSSEENADTDCIPLLRDFYLIDGFKYNDKIRHIFFSPPLPPNVFIFMKKQKHLTIINLRNISASFYYHQATLRNK